MNHKGFTPIAFILIIFVVFVVGSAAVYVKNKFASAPAPQHPLATSTPQSSTTTPQTTSTSTVDTSGWKTYHNELYGFEFQYPFDYSLEVIKDYKGSDWRFKLTNLTQESLFIIRVDNRFPELDTFEKFALEMSKIYCSADGPDGSVYCSDENRKSTFTNPAGIVGYEIYLSETTENYVTNKKTTRVRGPIFVLDFSALNNSGARGIILNGEDAFSDREMIVQIISTFKFIGASTTKVVSNPANVGCSDSDIKDSSMNP